MLTPVLKKSYNHFKHIELPKHISTIDSRGMQTYVKININKE